MIQKTLKRLWQYSLLVSSFVLISMAPLHATESIALKSLNSGNHFAIMRHAIAPGMGDPSNFDVKDCTTQRNLSQEGIDQSKSIGQRFKDSGINSAQVFASQWCRCIDTAKYLGLGTATELPIINSFFQQRDQEPKQTQKLKQWLAKQDLSKPLILVAHQVNITALTGVYPASGEIIIVKRESNGNLTVTDRVQTD